MRVEDIPRAKVLLGISPLLIYMRRARMSGSENFPPSSDEAAFSEAEWQKCYQEKRAGLEVLFAQLQARLVSDKKMVKARKFYWAEYDQFQTFSFEWL